MLARNPKERITAKECLNHAWFKAVEGKSEEENLFVEENI